MCKVLSSPPLVQPSAEAPQWPEKNDFKNYPHFDWHISKDNILKLVTDPEAVAKNSFYPFLRYSIKYKRFGGTIGADGKLVKRKPKERIIRYAARRDAYIYAYYRRLLMKPYEQILRDTGLDECVIAYRKIPVFPGAKQGKNNINFANEAFDEIVSRQDCYAIAMDISSFFESLDHTLLAQRWARVLGKAELDKDHAAVFRSITNYSYVFREECYQKLGFVKKEIVDGKEVWKREKNIPVKLCTRAEFIEHIVGTKETTLVHKNGSLGIPQGSPISDVLANLYLLDFDIAAKKFADEMGAYYRRYSDDILFICPKSDGIIERLNAYVAKEIKKAGSELTIKPEKTNITEFTGGTTLTSKTVKLAPETKEKPFEYLGFSFDGTQRLIRNTTMSNFYRKVAASCHAYANELVTRYPKKSFDEIMKKANLPRFMQNFGNVEEFEDKCSDDPKKWTFLTYAKRAAKITKNPKIMEQVSRRNEIITHRLEHAVRRRMSKLKPV